MAYHFNSRAHMLLLASVVIFTSLPVNAQQSTTAKPIAQPGSGTSGQMPPDEAPTLDRGMVRIPRFHFTIAPDAPLRELLPTPPTVKPVTGPVLIDDLSLVPEVEFQERFDKLPPADKVAHQLAKMNHLNAKKTDGFMLALIENRADLAGLPFLLGSSCQSSADRMKDFMQAVATVHDAGTRDSFWPKFTKLCKQQDAPIPSWKPEIQERVNQQRIAALTQMLAVDSMKQRMGLVDYLSTIDHADSTRALARLAIFSTEDELCAAAVEAIRKRHVNDYTDVLLMGLKYPWPAVARRSAEAIASLKRLDMIPDLIAVLKSDDPRLPTVARNGQHFVRELVKVSHTRNCMLCHSSVVHQGGLASPVTAQVPTDNPTPQQPPQGYHQSLDTSLSIRIDFTYLRQDFSQLLNIRPKSMSAALTRPDIQRFDFLVRDRKLSLDEAREYKSKLSAPEAGAQNPYHDAALAALGELFTSSFRIVW